MMATAVETAKKNGLYTIVVDYNMDYPAKRIADKCYCVSTSNIDALAEICREEQVDGVFSGYSELNQFFTLELTEKTGLFNYCNREQLNTLANKRNFKDACVRYGVPIVPEYEVEDLYSCNNTCFPVIVKPVDSYSGKGITICYGEEEIQSAISKAIEASRSSRYIIEKYMDDNDYDVIASYYDIQNGVVALSSMADRLMVTFPNNRRLNTALVYPSQYLDRYLEQMNNSVCKMISSLGIKNGTVFFEGCVDKNSFYFWESGFRLCGAQQNIFPSFINNVDIQELLINYAVSGKMSEINMMEREDPFFKGKFACNGVLFLKPGVVDNTIGIEDVSNIPGVISFTQLIEKKKRIEENDIGTLNQSFARFHIVGDSKEELCEIIKRILSTVSVVDEYGNNMVLQTFNYGGLCSKKRFI